MNKKFIWFAGLGLAIDLYSTFVLQQLWNWFLTTTLHVGEISYWAMYGIQLMPRLLTSRSDDRGETYLWERTSIMLYSCVPEDRRESLKQELDKQDQELWVRLGSSTFSQIAGTSVALAVGWVIHVAMS